MMQIIMRRGISQTYYYLKRSLIIHEGCNCLWTISIISGQPQFDFRTSSNIPGLHNSILDLLNYMYFRTSTNKCIISEGPQIFQDLQNSIS